MMTYSSVSLEREHIQDLSSYGFDAEQKLIETLSEEIASMMDAEIMRNLGIESYDEKLKKLTDRLNGKK